MEAREEQKEGSRYEEGGKSDSAGEQIMSRQASRLRKGGVHRGRFS